MTQESARSAAPALQVESLSFAEIPGQSRLFLDYLQDPLSLREYYPNTVASPAEVGSFCGTVLSAYKTDRDGLCDALAEINRAAAAGTETFANIELLRLADTVAVVTGQQVGLFTGPLYTIYKALSAIKLAGQLRSTGINAVPVFWAASEDHDLDEIDHVLVPDKNGGLFRASYRPTEFTDGTAVGAIQFDAAIGGVVDELISHLPATEFSASARDLLRSAYADRETYASAFNKLIVSLLGKHGLIVVDPLNDKIKQLAAPIYAAAVERADAIVDAIRVRTSALEASGYGGQVLVEEDYFPLFWHDDAGRRLALRKSGDGRYRVKGGKIEFTRDGLVDLARNEPVRLSPGVMLRPVVQDYLLPTVCYFGGGAEIAYFAQNSEAYRVLDRPVTPIFHRQSFTIVEPRERRNLQHLGWGLTRLFGGKDAAIMSAAESELSPEIAELFIDVEQRFADELDRLEVQLADTDPTLAANLATRRRKIMYHVAALRKKTLLSQIQRDETMRRRIDDLFDNLLPNGALQERSLNVLTYLNKYGPGFIEWLYEAVEVNDKHHRVITL
ncbi:MAG TPA: bacillithiol biosynthesis cysteine-adding enzyme BshC [Pyrinomonadaceae bacterium]|nr:bacillithiol biosynthesis cysteine-adding enzyme BshC [Pyrinomonadaceae bacterium]